MDSALIVLCVLVAASVAAIAYVIGNYAGRRSGHRAGRLEGFKAGWAVHEARTTPPRNDKGQFTTRHEAP